MYDLSTQGILPVEDMNALFEERLRVKLPGGLYKVSSRSYSCDCVTKVYEHQLPLSMSIRFQPVGRRVANLDHAPAASKGTRNATTGKSNTN